MKNKLLSLGLLTVFLFAIIGVANAAQDMSIKDFSKEKISGKAFIKENNGVKFNKDVKDPKNFKVTKDIKHRYVTVSLENERAEVTVQKIGIPLSDLKGFTGALKVKHFNDKKVLDKEEIVYPLVVDNIAYLDVEFTTVTIEPLYSYLSNWDFEDWSSDSIPVNWSSIGSAGSRSTDAAMGSYSYKITGMGNAVEGELLQNYTGFETNSTYVYGAWIKVTNSSSGALNLDFWNSTQDAAGLTWIGNTDWRWVEYQETMRKDSGFVRVFVNGAPNTGSEWFVDGIVLGLPVASTATETSNRTHLTQTFSYTVETLRPSACFVTEFESFTVNDLQNYAVSATVDNTPVNTWAKDAKIYVDVSNQAAGSHIISVVAVNSNPITADFTVSTTNVYTGHSVSFSGESSGYPAATSWLWDFGNGNTSTAQNPTFTYTSAGVYTVSLSVSNGLGSHTVVKSGISNATVLKLIN